MATTTASATTAAAASTMDSEARRGRAATPTARAASTSATAQAEAGPAPIDVATATTPAASPALSGRSCRRQHRRGTNAAPKANAARPDALWLATRAARQMATAARGAQPASSSPMATRRASPSTRAAALA